MKVKNTHKKYISILWLRIHDIQDKLGDKNVSDLVIRAIKGIYNTKNFTKEQIRKYIRYGKELTPGETGIYIRESLNLSIIMNCRLPTATEFRKILGFKEFDLIMTKKQSMLTKLMKIFANKKYCSSILV